MSITFNPRTSNVTNSVYDSTRKNQVKNATLYINASDYTPDSDVVYDGTSHDNFLRRIGKEAIENYQIFDTLTALFDVGSAERVDDLATYDLSTAEIYNFRDANRTKGQFDKFGKNEIDITYFRENYNETICVTYDWASLLKGFRTNPSAYQTSKALKIARDIAVRDKTRIKDILSRDLYSTTGTDMTVEVPTITYETSEDDIKKYFEIVGTHVDNMTIEGNKYNIKKLETSTRRQDLVMLVPKGFKRWIDLSLAKVYHNTDIKDVIGIDMIEIDDLGNTSDFAGLILDNSSDGFFKLGKTLVDTTSANQVLDKYTNYFYHTFLKMRVNPYKNACLLKFASES